MRANCPEILWHCWGGIPQSHYKSFLLFLIIFCPFWYLYCLYENENNGHTSENVQKCDTTPLSLSSSSYTCEDDWWSWVLLWVFCQNISLCGVVCCRRVVHNLANNNYKSILSSLIHIYPLFFSHMIPDDDFFLSLYEDFADRITNCIQCFRLYFHNIYSFVGNRIITINRNC